MAEKKEEKKPEKESTPEEEAQKGKKKKLIIFASIGSILTFAIAGGAFFFLASGGSKEAPVEEANKKEEAEAGKAEKPGDNKGEKVEGGEKATESENKDAKKEGADDKADSSKDKKKDDKKSADKKIDGIDFGCTIAVGPFHLNLGNPLENRYIRLDLAIEYGCSEDQKGEIEKRMPQLKNAVISVTTRKTREFLLGPDGKEQLRKEILNRINHFMTKKVDDVYITEIIIE